MRNFDICFYIPILRAFEGEGGGADVLIQSGWNLAEAEAEFGENWLRNN